MGVSVSNTDNGEAVDLQTIMNGGANWMARMTAFAEAQDKANAAIKDAGIVGDILAKQSEVTANREESAKALVDARKEADGIVSEAKKQAQEIISKAQAEAAKIASDAKQNAAEVAQQASQTLLAAQEKMAEAEASSQKATARNTELDQRESELIDREQEAAAHLKAAAETKAVYQSFAMKLSAVLAEEPKNIPA